MSDLFSFQSELDVKKVGVVKEINPLLYTNAATPEVYFLVDSPLPKPQIDKLAKFILFTKPGLKFQILSTFSFQPRQKDLERSIVSFYGHQSIDLSQYIAPWSKIVTVGRSLYSILRSDDLNIEGFYDTIQWHTNFLIQEQKVIFIPAQLYILFWKRIRLSDSLHKNK